MSKTVEIYIGFMEEEISPLLKSLLKKYKEKIPVRAISRGPIEPTTQLFEQDFKYYGVEKPSCFVAKENSGPLGDRVADNLREAFFEKPESSVYVRRVVPRILTQYKKDGKNEREQKVIKDSAALSVVYLNDKDVAAADGDGTPIVCYAVQSPEMGKQPSIVRAYLRAILKAILAAHEGAKVHVVTVGAGGGIPMGIAAGQLVKLGASIFIGVEQDEKGKLYSVVDIAGIVPVLVEKKLTGLKPLRADFLNTVLGQLQIKDSVGVGPHTRLFKVEVRPPQPEGTYNPIAVAERLATAMVTGKTLQEIAEIKDENDPYYGVKVFLTQNPPDRSIPNFANLQKVFPSIVQAIGNQYEEISKALNYEGKDWYRISASWSYFDQKEEKDAVWHKLGRDSQIVANSNMEDYHVFRVLESMLTPPKDKEEPKYPELLDFSTIRLTANPNASEKAIGLLKTWLASKPKYTIADWVDSIHWGLRGCPTEGVKDLPGNVCLWNACFTSTKEGLEANQLYDFIYPVVDDKGLPIYALDPFCVDLAQDFLKELPQQYPDFFTSLGEKYKTKDRGAIDREELKNNREAVEELVRAFLETHRKEYYAEPGLFYIWIRNKWKQTREGGNVLTPDVRINDHDRMLYRSGNIFAMRDMPGSLTMMKGAA